MARAKKPEAPKAGNNWVEGTLGDFKAVPGKNKRIDLLVVVPFTRGTCEELAQMMDYKVRLREPNRGTLRPELGEIIGEIVDWKVKNGAKLQNGARAKGIVVKLVLDFSQAVNDGLFQIAEASPSTVELEQTQIELELKGGHGEEE